MSDIEEEEGGIRVIRSKIRTSMGAEEDPKEYDNLRQIFLRILVSNGFIGFLVFIFMLIWVIYYGGGFDWNNPAGSVNIHIGIMLFFMVYLHGHGSLIYRILPNPPKWQVKLMHAGIHLCVCIGTAVGLAAAIQSHNLKKAAHFYTLHSWIGITAISLYYLQFVAGFATFLLPYAPMNIRLAMLPIHRFSGQSIFTLACGATVTGIMLKAISSLGSVYSTFPAPGIILNFAGFFTILFLILVNHLLGDWRFRRRPRPGPDGEVLLTADGRAVETDQSDVGGE